MVRPDETSSDPGPLHVSLPVLRGYATVLDDVSRDLGGCEALASSYCVDADFGKIVEDLTSDYATLLPQLQELLAENETVMAQYALAIDRTASDFAHTDDGNASRFQWDGINADSGTTSFTVSSVGSSTPYAPEGELPEVSFGFLFDRLARAIETFVGWDVRGAVTDWIAGDVQGLSTQASCWEIIGERLDVTRGNLTSADMLLGQTWQGQAADMYAGGMITWDMVLESQAQGFRDLGESLKSLAEEAVNVAQLVVDCIRLATGTTGTTEDWSYNATGGYDLVGRSRVRGDRERPGDHAGRPRLADPGRPGPRGLPQERRRVADRGGQLGQLRRRQGEGDHQRADAGTYVLRVINVASVSPTYTLTASLFNATAQTTAPLVEAWTLTCERDGRVLQTVPIVVERGQQVSVDLKECTRRWNR